MLTLTTITAFLASASLATAAVGTPRITTTSHLVVPTPTPHTTSSTFVSHPQAPVPTKVEAARVEGPAQMTLTFNNVAGVAVTTHHYSNQREPTLPTPPAAPTPGVMAHGESMHYIVPLGFAGTMMVSAGAMLGQESQVEYSFTTQANINKADIDVSYVKAYSFSIMCYCSDGSTKAGCDIPLFAKHECVAPDHLNAAGSCVNSAPNAGPASPFFADCKDQAYVYALNDLANNNGECATGNFRCDILPNGK